MRKAVIALKKLAAAALVLAMALSLAGCSSSDYSKAGKLYDSGDYMAAQKLYESLGDYRDSQERAQQAYYAYADALEQGGDYASAVLAFKELGDYSDSADRAQHALYLYAGDALEKENYEDAANVYQSLGDYQDSAELYGKAKALFIETKASVELYGKLMLANYVNDSGNAYSVTDASVVAKTLILLNYPELPDSQFIESLGDANASTLSYYLVLCARTSARYSIDSGTVVSWRGYFLREEDAQFCDMLESVMGSYIAKEAPSEEQTTFVQGVIRSIEYLEYGEYTNPMLSYAASCYISEINYDSTEKTGASYIPITGYGADTFDSQMSASVSSMLTKMITAIISAKTAE